jgi:hypothetical protein
MTRYGYFRNRDPERSGSRFSRTPAIAFVPPEQDLGTDAERRQAIEEVVGAWALEDQPELGRVRVLSGGHGIGAEAWAVILEWAAQGAVGGAAWVATVAARRLRAFLDRFYGEAEREPSVSAGAARLLAIDAVLREFPEEPGPLDTEALEDTSTLGGNEPIALTFGDAPWILSLVNTRSAFRYVTVVQSDGHVGGVIRVPLRPAELFEGVRVEIPGERRPTDEAADHGPPGYTAIGREWLDATRQALREALDA